MNFADAEKMLSGCYGNVSLNISFIENVISIILLLITNQFRHSILHHKVKMQYVHFRFHTNYFILPRKIPEEIRRQSVFFNNLKNSVIFKQPLTMEVERLEIGQ